MRSVESFLPVRSEQRVRKQCRQKTLWKLSSPRGIIRIAKQTQTEQSSKGSQPDWDARKSSTRSSKTKCLAKREWHPAERDVSAIWPYSKKRSIKKGQPLESDLEVEHDVVQIRMPWTTASETVFLGRRQVAMGTVEVAHKDVVFISLLYFLGPQPYFASASL